MDAEMILKQEVGKSRANTPKNSQGEVVQEMRTAKIELGDQENRTYRISPHIEEVSYTNTIYNHTFQERVLLHLSDLKSLSWKPERKSDMQRDIVNQFRTALERGRLIKGVLRQRKRNENLKNIRS